MHVGEEVKEGGKTYRCSLMDKGIKYDECSVSELHDECITQRGFFTEMNITVGFSYPNCGIVTWF